MPQYLALITSNCSCNSVPELVAPSLYIFLGLYKEWNMLSPHVSPKIKKYSTEPKYTRG